MLLEANMLHEMKVFVPHHGVYELDEEGKLWLPYEINKSRKRFYSIFERENLQDKITPISEEIIDGQTLVTFDSIYENKTAKLITAPLLIASELSGGKYRKQFEEFGYNLGVLFQIIDDIMDVEGTLESIGKTPHKDEEVGKLTSVKLFGLDGAKELAKKHYLDCKQILSDIDGCEFLLQLTDAMYVRRK